MYGDVVPATDVIFTTCVPAGPPENGMADSPYVVSAGPIWMYSLSSGWPPAVVVYVSDVAPFAAAVTVPVFDEPAVPDCELSVPIAPTNRLMPLTGNSGPSTGPASFSWP